MVIQDKTTIVAIAAVYLLTLMAVGLTFLSFSKDTSDYFRAGGKATWWLLGGSMLTLSEVGSVEIIVRMVGTDPLDERLSVMRTKGDRRLRIT